MGILDVEDVDGERSEGAVNEEADSEEEREQVRRSEWRIAH